MPDEGLSLAAALGLLWQRRGPLAEGVLQLDRLLAADDAQQCPSPAAILAPAVLEACTLACFQGEYPKRCGWPGRPSSCASRWGTTGAWPGRTASWARWRSARATTPRPSLISSTSWPKPRRSATWPGKVTPITCSARTPVYQGEYRRASSLLWRALKLFRASDDPDGVSVILSSLGEVARDAGRPGQARRLFGAALRRHAAFGNKRHMAYELEGFAAAAAQEHAGQQALVYLGAAQVLREQTGGPLPPVEQAILDRILAPAVAALSAGQRQGALSQGRQPAAAGHHRAGLGRVALAARAGCCRNGLAGRPGEAN